ncbi:alkyl hydroperoxide reductase AhpD [Planotetraspora thailandica]|uniref:Alkyl hydroperoxide reductase AhpD n=2 Tax=Planotetraspora thailandica TaxID=487172 RepID=A0A8J3XYQ7_9ACTN|nr:alkyl hydroperoxide reductase AhpD [Planotetraspora thailandica]
MARMNFGKAAPKASEALMGLERFVRSSSLPHSTLELVKLRASQINGCGFCVDMHSRDAKKAGETDERLFAVAAWRDTPYFTEAERAALALAEAGTRLSDRPEPVPDEVWDEAARHYDEETLAALVAAIAAINAWNRISVITRATPGAHL